MINVRSLSSTTELHLPPNHTSTLLQASSVAATTSAVSTVAVPAGPSAVHEETALDLTVKQELLVGGARKRTSSVAEVEEPVPAKIMKINSEPGSPVPPMHAPRHVNGQPKPVKPERPIYR